MSATYNRTRTEPASGWVRFDIAQDSRLRALVGHGAIWSQGTIDVARELVNESLGFDPMVPYCECPLHTDLEVSATEFPEVDGIDGLATLTMEMRNSRIGRNGQEEQVRPNPNEYRNPIARDRWIGDHPRITVLDLVFNSRRAHFIFATKDEHDRFRLDWSSGRRSSF